MSQIYWNHPALSDLSGDCVVPIETLANQPNNRAAWICQANTIYENTPDYTY